MMPVEIPPDKLEEALSLDVVRLADIQASFLDGRNGPGEPERRYLRSVVAEMQALKKLDGDTADIQDPVFVGRVKAAALRRLEDYKAEQRSARFMPLPRKQ